MLVKAFRLFVSSTFMDFVDERELLQSQVFPVLDAYCAQKGYQFHAVDMRWGVSEEAQLDQRTSEICLGEVEAAKSYPPPNLLVLVGDRYGWVPLPYAIAQDEFEAAVAWLAERGETESVDELRTAYQLDENTLVPSGLRRGDAHDGERPIGAYCLRSREQGVLEFARVDVWERVEDRLRAALQAAADHLLEIGHIKERGHRKYFLSLTEQEIMRGLSRGPATSAQATVWLRERAEAIAPGWEQPEVQALKAAIRRKLPEDCVFTARTSRDDKGRLDASYFASFTSTIERVLKEAIDAYIARYDAVERTPDFELQAERAAHRSFAEERLKVFIGREKSRAQIAGYISGDASHPLVLHGTSGSGKSALMARSIADAKSDRAGIPIVYRFIGASSNSSDQRSLLISLIEDMANHGIVLKPEAWQDDVSLFAVQIRTLLSSIGERAIIFIDALDQLRRPQRPTWLPDTLPSGLRIIVSSLDDESFPADSQTYVSLRQRLPGEAFLAIEALDRTESDDILRALENDANRRLQDSQRAHVLEQFEKADCSPLYLRVAFEIAKGWRSTDDIGAGAHALAENTEGLISQFISDLTDVHHHNDELVTRTLGYLAAAKDGLSAKELTEVLARDVAVMTAISSDRHGAHTNKLPASVWIRLQRQLAPFLVEKRVDGLPLLQFFHREVGEFVRKRYYDPAKNALHAALAAYFDPGGGSLDPEASVDEAIDISTYDRRSLSELPFQLHHAESATRLDQVLLSAEWMQQKLNAFGPQVLITDYDLFGCSQLHGVLHRTLRLLANILARDARQLLPQLVCRLMTLSDPAVQALVDRIRTLIKRPALVTLDGSLSSAGTEISVLEAGVGRIQALSALPDGRLACGSADWSVSLWDSGGCFELSSHSLGDQCLALTLLTGGRLAAACRNGTIHVWEPDGNNSASFIFQAHIGSVRWLAALPNSKIASSGDDGTLKVWNLASRTEVLRISVRKRSLRVLGDWLKGYGWKTKLKAMALVALPDGRLASSFTDQSIRIWDPATGAEIKRIEGAGFVTELAVLPDGRLASAGNGGTVRLWNTSSGTAAGFLKYNSKLVSAICALPDGRLAIASADFALGEGGDRSVLVWDPNGRVAAENLVGSTQSIWSMAVLRDGSLATGSDDGTIRIFSLDSAAARDRAAEPAAHTNVVSALVALPDGRVASGSWDGRVGLWDPVTRANVTYLRESFASRITGLTGISNGRLASSHNSGHLSIWDLKQGNCTALCQISCDCGALATLPHNLLALGEPDGVHIWYDRTLEMPCGSYTNHQAISAVVALPDGRAVSGSRNDNSLHLWEVSQEGQPMEVQRFQGHKGEITALSVFADGRLASAARDRTIRLWDLRNGREIARFESHSGDVVALAVLNDSRFASASNEDRTVRLWDASSETELCRMEFDSPVWSLCSVANNRLVAGDQNGRLHWLEIIEGHSAVPLL